MNAVRIVPDPRHGEWKIMARAEDSHVWALVGVAYTESVANVWARSLRGPPAHSGCWSEMVHEVEDDLNAGEVR